MRMIRKSMLLLSSSLLAGCVVTTRVVEHYDEECQIVTKHVVLNTKMSSDIGACRSTQECIGNLVGIGVMSAASVVISGSVVMVGNTVYWLEKQGQCQSKEQRKDQGNDKQQNNAGAAA